MKKLTFIVLLAVGFCGFIGCKKKETQKQLLNTPMTIDQAKVLPAEARDFVPETGAYGTVTQCPVNREKVVVDKNTAGVKYKDKEYYFCCPTCITEFKANPEKYIQK
jgi:YHS domain-containing protein